MGYCVNCTQVYTVNKHYFNILRCIHPAEKKCTGHESCFELHHLNPDIPSWQSLSELGDHIPLDSPMVAPLNEVRIATDHILHVSNCDVLSLG